jgi:hypothetical protein
MSEESEEDVQVPQSTEEEEQRKWRLKAMNAVAMGEVLYPKIKDSVWRQKDVIVEFEKLEWDIHATQGQARPFSSETLRERKENMRQAMPSSHIHCILWPSDIHGMQSEDARLQYTHHITMYSSNSQTRNSSFWVDNMVQRPSKRFARITFNDMESLTQCPWHYRVSGLTFCSILWTWPHANLSPEQISSAKNLSRRSPSPALPKGCWK